MLLRIEKYYGGELPVEAVTESLVRGWAKDLQSTLRRSSACTYLQRLYAALEYAYRQGMVAEQRLPKISSMLHADGQVRQKMPLTFAELHRLEHTAAPHESTRRAFLFAAYTGLRLSDIETLCWGHIVADGDGMRLEKHQVKTGACVVVPLTRQARELLWLRTAADLDGNDPEQRVFGDLMSRSTIASDLRIWAAQTGVEKEVSFHVARHTFASLLSTMGVPMADVSQLCGHSSITVTQRYVHSFESARLSAIHLLESGAAAQQPHIEEPRTDRLMLVGHRLDGVMHWLGSRISRGILMLVSVCNLLIFSYCAFGMQKYKQFFL